MFLTPDHLVRELSLKPGDVVADIGCGSGAYTVALAQEVGDIGRVYAVDVHREALHTLAGSLEKQDIMNVEIIWADIEKRIPIDVYSLDAVVISNILFQLENKDEAMSRIVKLLKPGGLALVVDWSHSHGGIGPSSSHVLSESQAEELAKKHGLRIQKRLFAGDYHYAFIALSA